MWHGQWSRISLITDPCCLATLLSAISLLSSWGHDSWYHLLHACLPWLSLSVLVFFSSRTCSFPHHLSVSSQGHSIYSHELGPPGPKLICALLLVFGNYWSKWEFNSRDKELHLRELFGVMLKDTYAWYHWCQNLTTEVTSAFSINKTGYKCIIDHRSSN